MRMQIRTLLCAAGLVALGACGETGRDFYGEAGASLDEGGFGNPTMQNMLAQMCIGQAKGHIVPDPIVVLDPRQSTPSQPVYYRGQVRCSGHLNGKYAEVIFQEYITSAVPLPVIEEATAEEGGG